MKHLTCQLPNAQKNEREVITPAAQSRRTFFKFLGGSAAALALQGCGAGGSALTLTYTPNTAASAPVPTTPAPVTTPPSTPTPTPTVPSPTITWQSIPAVAFTEGVPGTFSVADYVSVANASSFSVYLNSSLPPGVTFDTTKRAFIYDGKGAIGALDGVVLTATVA